MDDDDDSSAVSSVLPLNYTASTPFITHLNHGGDNPNAIDPYVPIFEGERQIFEALFLLPNGCDPSPSSVCELFLPDSLLDAWVSCTNAYAASRLHPQRLRYVSRMHLLRFISTIMYMGVVRLPSKDDYFIYDDDESFWPKHKTILLTNSMFNYLWRNFHTSFVQDDSADEIIAELDEGYDYVEEQEESPEPEEEELEPVVVPIGKWYEKVEGFLNHINKVSKLICRRPGSHLAIDEMMKKFKGRSSQTHRMAKKPIKEGYKFYALCDSSSGFIYEFFPDGRMEKNTIAGSVGKLIDCIPRRNELQYVVTMDNFFTTPRVMVESRQKNVGVIGTARNRRGWPDPEYRNIGDDRFNSLYVWHHQDNYLVCRWVDNNVVNMVSTIHTGDETVVRHRRKPRQTRTNRNHLELVWGNNPIATIDIPGIVDDYNHWMGGVDKADQLISYYRPNLRCRRTWMPIFIHGLDIIRVNGFLAVKSKIKNLDHKDFVKEFIHALNKRSLDFDSRVTRSVAVQTTTSPPGSGEKSKRRRMSHVNPTLPETRLQGNQHEHQVQLCGKQRRCVYCSYLISLAKSQGTPPEAIGTPRIVRRRCSYCKVHICKDHWNDYHGQDS